MLFPDKVYRTGPVGRQPVFRSRKVAYKPELETLLYERQHWRMGLDFWRTHSRLDELDYTKMGSLFFL